MGIALIGSLLSQQNIDPNIRSLMNTVNQFGNTQISRGKWKKLGFCRQANKIKEWKVKEALELYENYEINIIVQISNINFPQLKQIFFNHNLIESIQALSSIRLHELEKLYLPYNNISSIKPLRRCNFPKLRILCIVDNNICELSTLSQLDSSELQLVYGQYKNSLPYATDLNSMFKIQSIKIKQIIFLSLKRGKLAINQQFYGKKYDKVVNVS